ncbi:GNAT family N-acetyltransferase [Deinococcus multiflagellatus]|uniref:GNAT family N-acetyltransferase n=1 Tax=Deinococcus multiflagellatus TaxID=1656887 RepID=A0ABW1ZM20_9DEIO|nr:GNAT family protein [Deinococcus multiflagellatus]MBZ9713198.1 GNAT family N-acetyltransferase [Deinococcus multiflagellatus]
MTTLHTPRLTLRPITPADLPEVVAYRNDPAVARFQAWPLPATLETVQGLVSDRPLGAPGWVQRAVTLGGGPLLGDVALNTHGPQAELGVTLATAAQGQGYAAEALRALIDHAFGPLGLHRLHASIDPRNAAVARLLTRLGFRHEGTAIQGYWHRGEWTDDASYALLAAEWTP